MLLRVIGAGTDLHPMHHHGNNSWAIGARRPHARLPTTTSGPDLAFSDYTIRWCPARPTTRSGPGPAPAWAGTYGNGCDPAVRRTERLHAHRPQQHQLQRPRQGHSREAAPRVRARVWRVLQRQPVSRRLRHPPRSAGRNQHQRALSSTCSTCNNEREVVNGGIFPGGMMTMMVIEPPGVVTIDSPEGPRERS